MEATPSVDEIDISDEQSLQLVLNFLEKHFPESFYLWQFFNYIQQHLLTKDRLWPHQLFVNDRHEIKCILFIYCTIAFRHDYQSLTEEEKSIERRVIFFCDPKNDHLLIPLIQQYVPWLKIKKIVFCVIQHRFSLMIESFIRDNNLGKCDIHSFQQMELDKETFAEKSKALSCSRSSDIVIRPLSVSDASEINDSWTYKSAVSLCQIMYEIEHLPAFGAYRNEELISWSLTKYDGSIGTVFTKPEARGLGLAAILNVYVASKLFERQKQICCFVAHDNIASLSMVQKLGYHRTCDVDWLVFASE